MYNIIYIIACDIINGSTPRPYLLVHTEKNIINEK